MADRKPFMGAHEANIPIEEIVREYAAWTDEIVEAVSKELLKEVRARAKTAFKDVSGRTRKHIRRKKSKYDKDTHIVGMFWPTAHLIEFGTGVRVDKRGKVSGHMPASPFLAPAEEEIRSRMKQIVERVVAPTYEVKG
jgi:hypothetical protein